MTNKKDCATIEQIVQKYCAESEQVVIDKNQLIGALRKIAEGKRMLEKALK